MKSDIWTEDYAIAVFESYCLGYELTNATCINVISPHKRTEYVYWYTTGKWSTKARIRARHKKAYRSRGPEDFVQRFVVPNGLSASFLQHQQDNRLIIVDFP